MAMSWSRPWIDVLTTEVHQLLSKGEVACCFHDLTIDTPRNRLVRSALDLLARLVRRERLAQRSRSLASSLARLGVGGIRPSRSDLVLDQIGRNDTGDLFMVALAHLAFDLALPRKFPGRPHWLHQRGKKFGFVDSSRKPSSDSLKSSLNRSDGTCMEASLSIGRSLPCPMESPPFFLEW
jgi:hypothetical protein